MYVQLLSFVIFVGILGGAAYFFLFRETDGGGGGGDGYRDSDNSGGNDALSEARRIMDKYK